jgi:PAS domain S-box-containing protein
MNSVDNPLAAEDLITLFQTTPDLVCIADKIGYFINFNAAVSHTLGYSRDELLAEPIANRMHPDDREMTLNRRARLLHGETMVNFQNRYITKEGNIVWLEWTSVYLPEKELVFAIAKNITARKEMEKRVEQEFTRLREQTVQFKNNLETDRKYVAAELHEDLAQLATAVKVDLDWINSNVDAPEKSRKRMEHALITADLLIGTIRRISFSISPAMLDDLGLEPTLEWYCKEFSMTSGIACAFESKFNESALSKEIKLDFFRICQQALANIKNHAKASSVKISIKEKKESIILTILDDADHTHEDTSGLLSIAQRAESIGATCNINHSGIMLTLTLSS